MKPKAAAALVQRSESQVFLHIFLPSAPLLHFLMHFLTSLQAVLHFMKASSHLSLQVSTSTELLHGGGADGGGDATATGDAGEGGGDATATGDKHLENARPA